MSGLQAQPGDLLILTPEQVQSYGLKLDKDKHFLIRMQTALDDDDTFQFEVITGHKDYAVVDAYAHMLAPSINADVYHTDDPNDGTTPH